MKGILGQMRQIAQFMPATSGNSIPAYRWHETLRRIVHRRSIALRCPDYTTRLSSTPSLTCEPPSGREWRAVQSRFRSALAAASGFPFPGAHARHRKGPVAVVKPENRGTAGASFVKGEAGREQAPGAEPSVGSALQGPVSCGRG